MMQFYNAEGNVIPVTVVETGPCVVVQKKQTSTDGYDALHLLARAVRDAGTTDGARVRDALERLGPYEGLIKDYDRPFAPERHDALGAEDYLMATWQDGRLVLAEPSRPEP